MINDVLDERTVYRGFNSTYPGIDDRPSRGHFVVHDRRFRTKGDILEWEAPIFSACLLNSV